MKKIKLFLPLVALGLFSCSDYMDVNTSPNNPNADLVTPNLAISAAQTGPYRVISRNANILGNLWMNNWGYNVNSFAVTNPTEFSLNLDNSTYASIWDGLYTSTANLTNIIEHPSTEHDNHKAIAKILKSFYFQYLVDLYGDIPYFEAHQGTLNMTPTYDDDQVIYRDLVEEIEEAIAMINNPVAGTRSVGNEDVMMNGDMQRWIEFGNTLKLRMLLRQSEMNDAETQSYLAAEYAELATADFLDEDAVINPGYANNAEQQNPFFDMFYLVGPGTLAERETNLYRQYRASDWFADNLNAGPVDPRRGRIFALVGGSVVGVVQGEDDTTAAPSLSGLGPGILTGSEQNGYVITLAESKLLQAEAALRGLLPGDAQTLFNEAIVASMNIMGTVPGSYITDINLLPGKGLGVGTFDDKIRAIMYQKNIALTGINSIESFIDHTRTGVIDQIPLALGAAQPHKPRRLLYPTSELVGNAANVPTLSLNDVFNTGPFWFVD